MTNPAHNQVLIELHVPDFEVVKAYYGKLGFLVMRETKPEQKSGYLVLKIGGNILCFWAGNEHVYEQSYFGKFPRDTRRGYGVEIVIMVANIETYYQRVKDLVEIVTPLRKRPWGLRDFRLEDPFGYIYELQRSTISFFRELSCNSRHIR